MAIYFEKHIPGQMTDGKYVTFPSEQGVVGEGTTLTRGYRTVRIMSDVWDDELYGTYWDGTKIVDRGVEYAGHRWEKSTIRRDVVVDATPEVIALAEAWKARQARIASVQSRWGKRMEFVRTARRIGVDNYHVAKRLWKLSDANRHEAVELLAQLYSGSFRSAFRQSLAKQIQAWLVDPAPRYNSPLSAKQWEAVMNAAAMKRAPWKRYR